jgi:hypothetical protein
MNDRYGCYHQIVPEPIALLVALRSPHVPQARERSHTGIGVCHLSRHGGNDEICCHNLSYPFSDFGCTLRILLSEKVNASQEFRDNRKADGKPFGSHVGQP